MVEKDDWRLRKFPLLEIFSSMSLKDFERYLHFEDFILRLTVRFVEEE